MEKEKIKQLSELRCELVEIRKRVQSVQRQIDRIEREGTVKDRVRGGLGGLQTFQIEGFPHPEYEKKKVLLWKRKEELLVCENKIAELVVDIENYINSISDSHIRRIISLRVIDRLPWTQVAQQIGGGNTEDSVRKAFERHFD